MIFALVVLTGAFGALTRYFVNDWVSGWFKHSFPLGTMIVNASGSFLAGFIAGWVIQSGAQPLWVIPILTGYLGAYTTFSTWMVQSAFQIESAEYMRAFLNILGGIVTGVICALAGIYLGGGLA